MRGLALYGGESIGYNLKQLEKKLDYVVACPGRLKDLLNRRALQLNNIDTLVIDEVDRMLDMGFKEDIDEILTN